MNILVIMADQLRADCLGYIGHPVVRTPNLDRLAGEAFVFEKAYIQVPACLGSRSSILTGRYPATNRAHSMRILPPEEITLAEDLKRGGYRTGVFGKLHLTPQQYTLQTLGSRVPISDWRAFKEGAKLREIGDDPAKDHYGFEDRVECEDVLKGNWEQWLKERMDRPESYPDGEAGMRRFRPGVELVASGQRPPPLFPGGEAEGSGGLFVSPVPSQLHHSTFIASEAEEFVRGRAGAGPWFGLCSFVHPHHPFEAPADQIEKYPLEMIELPKPMGEPSAADLPPTSAGAIGQFNRLAPEAQRAVLRHYYASISLIDDCVGRLIDTLEQTDQLNDTIIVFASDHGEFAGAHGLLLKPPIHYEELIRVPLFIRAPGHGRGRRIQGMVELVDLYPTLMGLLGREIHSGVQGIDHSRALLRNEPIGREEIHCESYEPFYRGPGNYYGSAQTLRTEKWKLSVYPGATADQGFLFDLENDPGESTNLYHDPNHAATRHEMLWRLLRKKFHQQDPLPIRLSQF
jgi:arylsulfatase A-like enzyme